MDIIKMSIEQLKALCYDQIVLFNQAQNNINIIQAEIAKRQKEETKEISDESI